MKIRCYFLYLLVFLNFSVYGQEYAISIQHLTIEDGLSNRFVNSAFQDSKGFMWFSTNNGVCRWDGAEMKIFMERSAIWETMEDDKGRIWFKYSSFENLSLQNPSDFSIHLDPLANDSFFANQWTVCANLKGTILLRSLVDGQFYTYTDSLIPHPNLFGLIDTKIKSLRILPVSKDRFWIANTSSITLMDLNGQQHEQLKVPNQDYLFAGILADGQDVYYSLRKFIIDGNKQSISYNHFVKKPGQKAVPDSRYNNMVTTPQIPSFIQYPQRFTTAGGVTWERRLYQLSAKDAQGKVIFDFNEYYEEKLFCPNVLLDRQDNLWICTTKNGVYKVSITPSPFQSYLQNEKPNYSTRGIILLEDSILVHSYRGSKMVSVADGGAKPLAGTPENLGISVGIFQEDEEVLYWGQGKSTTLCQYNLKTKKLKEYTYPTKGYNVIYLPYKDNRSGTLWMSGTNHLSLFNDSTRQIEPFIFEGKKQPQNIRHFFEDDLGLWMVARNGLFLVDAKSRKIKEVFSSENGKLPCNQFNYIHKDKAGIYWLATQGFGLVRWNPADGTSKIYGRENGFLSLVIYTIYEDERNRLWMPTEYGLVLLNKETESVRVFLEQDGITHNEFNGFSHYRDNTGRFYFGGLNGFIAFDPENILAESSNNNPPLVLTAIKIADDENGNLIDITEKVTEEKKLILQPENKSFTIQFAFLDYNSHPLVEYAYIIEGLDKNWTYQKNNNIRLTGLPNGNYELVVKAKGINGIWSEQQIRLPVVVVKPFYLRWYFILLFLSIVGLLLYGYLRYRTHRLEKNARKLERQVALRTLTIAQQKYDLEKLNEAKDRIYAIIAHDLRDPVASFKGIAKKINFLLEKKDMSHVLKLSAFVENSAEELSKLLENLLQWARLQQKEMPFQPENHNIENLVKEVFGSLQVVATGKSIRLIYKGVPGLEVHGDYHMLTTIFRNLIDNALKFSYPNSSIEVTTKTENKKMILTLQDFGVGMTAEQLPHLFTIKKVKTTEGTLGERGTGLGMPLCKELLDLHGAVVQVESVLEGGTKVKLIFDWP